MKDAKTEHGRAMESCERKGGAAAAVQCSVSDDTPSPCLSPSHEPPPGGEGRRLDPNQQRRVDGNSEIMSDCLKIDSLDNLMEQERCVHLSPARLCPSLSLKQ